MEYRTLGKSGLRVSAVALGCGNFGGRLDLTAARAVAHRALDLGVTLFDTADRYYRGGSEEAVGRILGARRKDIVLATKFGRIMDDEEGRLEGGSRRYVLAAVEASLKRLATDWIDLYQMHVPDPFTPIEETLRALDDLVRAGKVRYIGCSNFEAWRTVDAVFTARQLGTAGFVSCQNAYSLLEREAEAELVPAIAAGGLALLPYFPLGRGMLAGRYRRGEPAAADSGLGEAKPFADRFLVERNFDVLDGLEAFAHARGRTTIELALSWLSRRPTVASIMVGASRPAQIEANVAATGWDLDADELAEIDRLTGPAP